METRDSAFPSCINFQTKNLELLGRSCNSQLVMMLISTLRDEYLQAPKYPNALHARMAILTAHASVDRVLLDIILPLPWQGPAG